MIQICTTQLCLNLRGNTRRKNAFFKISANSACLGVICDSINCWNSGCGIYRCYQKSNASILEEGLPNIAVPQWVENTFQYGAKATWEVNDCGEGGDGRVSPVCVEVKIPQQNGYYLHISSIVGDIEGKKTAKPQLWMVYFFKSENYKAIDIKNVKTIAEAIQLYKTDLSAKPK